MFDQVLDNFRKATESTLQLQQEMFRNWTAQWSQASGGMMPSGSALGSAWVDQVRSFQKAWASQVTTMLDRHREALDAQYKAGIQTIDSAFKVGEARDPEQFRRLTEQLWRQSFDALKTLSESQIKDFQATAEKWSEMMARGAQTTKI